MFYRMFATQRDAEYLYDAAREVFMIPTLEELRVGDLEEFFSSWEYDDVFQGPEIQHVHTSRGDFIRIVTETSRRTITVRSDEVTVEFPGGSQEAAGQILEVLRERDQLGGIKVECSPELVPDGLQPHQPPMCRMVNGEEIIYRQAIADDIILPEFS